MGVLLLDPHQGVVVPLNPVALGVAQDSARKLQSRYEGCDLVSREGEAWRIAKVEVLGAYGRTPLARLYHGAFGTRSIRTTLAPLDLPLEDLRIRVARYLAGDLERGDTDLPLEHLDELNAIAEQVRTAPTFAAVFDAIRFPPLDDCLDVL